MRVQKKSILENGIYATIAKIIGMIVPMMVIPYVLRALGVVSYGKISYVQSVIAYFALLSTQGISTYALRECSSVRDDIEKLERTSSLVFSMSLITTFLAYFLFLIYFFLVDEVKQEWKLNLVFSLSVIGSGLMMDWLYNSIERFDLISIRDVIGKIVYLFLCFVLIHESGDYVIYAAILIFSNPIMPMLFNWYGIAKGGCGVKPKVLFDKTLKNGLKSVFYLGLMTLGSKLFSSCDVVLTKWLVIGNGDIAVGLYNSGILLPLVVEQFLFVIASVMTPRLYNFIGNGEERKSIDLTNKISNAMYLIAIPSVVLCLFFPKNLLFLIGGTEYLGASMVLQIYSFILLTAIAITLAGTRTYVARKKEKKLFLILVMMAIVNIVLDCLFIPKYDIEGAALATLISNIFLMAIELTLERSWHYVFTKDKYIYVLGAILMILPILFVKNFIEITSVLPFLVFVFILAVFYLSFMVLFKESTMSVLFNRIK